jgi:hypothetical protein
VGTAVFFARASSAGRVGPFRNPLRKSCDQTASNCGKVAP